MSKLLKTAQEIQALETALRRKRKQLRRELQRAHAAGESVTELARRLDVTRTRIYQLLEERDDGDPTR